MITKKGLDMAIASHFAKTGEKLTYSQLGLKVWNNISNESGRIYIFRLINGYFKKDGSKYVKKIAKILGTRPKKLNK